MNSYSRDGSCFCICTSCSQFTGIFDNTAFLDKFPDYSPFKE